MKNSRHGNVFIAALIFVALALTTAGGLYLLQTRPSQPPVPSITQEPLPSAIPSEASTPTTTAVSKPTAVSPTTTTDATANWKKLQTAFDLEFKYPNAWFSEESGSSQFPTLRVQNYPIQKTGSGAYVKGQFYFVVQRFPVGDEGVSSIEQLINRLPKAGDSIAYIGSQEKLKIYQQETIVIGQHAALHRVYGPADIPSVKEEIYYVLSSGGNVIQIELKMDVISDRETFDQILATFKFLQ